MSHQNGLDGRKTETTIVATDARDERGRFARGNPGGPGRPRRTIEREYMATLGEAVTLDDWRDVVARAVADAKAGDQGARNWLAKYLLGNTPRSLHDIAKQEDSQWSVENEIRYGPMDQFGRVQEPPHEEEEDEDDFDY